MGLTPNDSRSGRTYSWGDETFVSVTTVLGCLNKPALTGWAARETAQYAVDNIGMVNDLIGKGQNKAAVDLLKGAPWRKRDTAADIGTLVHSVIEHSISGTVMDIPTDALLQLEYFMEWQDHFKPKILVSEGTIFNRTYNYAGTLDIVATIDNLNWLIDVKSGSGVYPEYAMQCAAYARGEFLGMPNGIEEPMPIIDKAAILHIRPNGYHFVPVSISKEVFESFLYCREMFRWQDDIAHRAILPEVRR